MIDRAHRRKLGQNYLIDPVILFEIERAISPQKNSSKANMNSFMAMYLRKL